MTLNDTPSANRLHIIVLGACNSGKSSVVNLLASQQVSLVSDIAGTTTDPVRKAMELPGIGPAVFIDTAGFDDDGTLGQARITMTEKALTRPTSLCCLSVKTKRRNRSGPDASSHVPYLRSRLSTRPTQGVTYPLTPRGFLLLERQAGMNCSKPYHVPFPLISENQICSADL